MKVHSIYHKVINFRWIRPLAIHELGLSGRLQKAQMDIPQLPADLDFRLEE
jgi:hypothetical protein